MSEGRRNLNDVRDDVRDEERESVNFSELAALRSRREKSLYVARKLFDDGVLPTAQRVREITGVGSFSDITEDVRVFWMEVRGRRHDPGLPDIVAESFLRIWHETLDVASKNFSEDRKAFELEQERLGADNKQLTETLAALSEKIERDATDFGEREVALLNQIRSLETDAARLTSESQSAAQLGLQQIQQLQSKNDELNLKRQNDLEYFNSEIIRLNTALDAVRVENRTLQTQNTENAVYKELFEKMNQTVSHLTQELEARNTHIRSLEGELKRKAHTNFRRGAPSADHTDVAKEAMPLRMTKRKLTRRR